MAITCLTVKSPFLLSISLSTDVPNAGEKLKRYCITTLTGCVCLKRLPVLSPLTLPSVPIPLCCRLDYRMEWDKAFKEYLKKLDNLKPVIYCGDLNVAHNPIGEQYDGVQSSQSLSYRDVLFYVCAFVVFNAVILLYNIVNVYCCVVDN